MRPLIGVTTSEMRPSGLSTLRRQGEPRAPRDGARHDVPAGDRAGGRGAGRAPAVRVRPRGADLAARRRVPERRPRSGPGGLRRPRPPRGARADGAVAGPRSSSRSPARALERGMPVLGICRGSQALNVACGGTLHQHLPGHRQEEPGHADHARGRDLRRHPPRRAARRRHDGRQLLPPPGGRPPRRRACGSPPARSTARSRRSSSRAASRSASSGTRRRSPTGGCSRRWSRPPHPRLKIAA